MDNKKELILQAASKVFSTVGYHKAKISKIAEIAGVGAGSVYLHFSNKEQILEEIFKSSWTVIEQKLQNLYEKKDIDSHQKIHILINTILELIIQKKDLAKLILHEYLYWSSGPSKEVNRIVQNSRNLLSLIISDGIQKGIFRQDINVNQVTEFIIGGMWHTYSYISDSLNEFNLSDKGIEIESYIFFGINNK